MAIAIPAPATGISPADADGRLCNLGFLLLSPPPGQGGEASLLVALRQRPTGAHFDPELIRYWWTGADGRGHRSELRLSSPMPLTRGFSWGKIEVADRFGIENEFVTVGGTLTADRTPDGIMAVLRSSAPILRMGGHSQAIDRMALGAFMSLRS